MNAYVLHALDPLLFGTGRPFTAVPGSRAESLPLPTPSMLAGMVRSTAGRDASGRFDAGRIDELLGYRVRGPFLATLTDDLRLGELAFPAPADALRLTTNNGDDHALRRLVPISLGADDRTDLTAGVPVGLVPPAPDKPARDVPEFWSATDLLAWLELELEHSEPQTWSSSRGVRAPRAELRTHVRVGHGGTADDGGLFATSGRRFAQGSRSLGLYLETDAPLPEAPVTLGGEGRLARTSRVPSALPKPPPAVLSSAESGFVRAVLVTPGSFGGSTLPSLPGVEVVGQVSGRPLTISGWDMAGVQAKPGPYRNAGVVRRGGRPKASRRLVPSGAVYFLRLTGTPAENRSFVEAHWARSLCPAGSQDHRDGFGIALFGTWDGRLHPLT